MAKPEATFTNIDALKRAVEQAPSNVVFCRGIDLREVTDGKPLTTKSAQEVQRMMRKEGLVVLPEIHKGQKGNFYVTKLGSKAELLCLAINNPDDTAGLERFRKAAG